MSICSPTRAAQLTGRNHQRVGNGTIAERAVDWDGYTGVIPKTSATMAEVMRHYGYKTPRPQFHHVNDIAPTIYEILGIKPPKVVDGFKQDPIDGVSLANTFTDAKGAHTQEGAILHHELRPAELMITL